MTTQHEQQLRDMQTQWQQEAQAKIASITTRYDEAHLRAETNKKALDSLSVTHARTQADSANALAAANSALATANSALASAKQSVADMTQMHAQAQQELQHCATAAAKEKQALCTKVGSLEQTVASQSATTTRLRLELQSAADSIAALTVQYESIAAARKDSQPRALKLIAEVTPILDVFKTQMAEINQQQMAEINQQQQQQQQQSQRQPQQQQQRGVEVKTNMEAQIAATNMEAQIAAMIAKVTSLMQQAEQQYQQLDKERIKIAVERDICLRKALQYAVCIHTFDICVCVLLFRLLTLTH